MSHLSKKWAAALLEEAQNKSEKDIEKLADRFLAVLKNEKKLYLAPSILNWLNKLLEQKKEKERLKIQAAREPAKNLTEKISKIFNIASTRIEVNVNPDLLGGLIIQHEDKIFNLSVKKQIEFLKKNLLA